MDPIADMLTKIRNAQTVSKPEVSIPFSKIKYQISKIIQKKGFIEKVEKKGRGVKKNIKLTLKYLNKAAAITGLKKISKPGQRIYLPAKKIITAGKGTGFSIVSTSKGVMTDKEARKKNLGGEIICKIW